MTRIIGHRGARGLAPENTLASFQAALDYNVDEIELDVRVTKDGVPVVHHNRGLAQNPDMRIADHTLKQLRAVDSDLPTLAEAIEFVHKRKPMLIEVKPKVDTAPVIATIQSYLEKGWHNKDFLLASFRQRTLVALHAALPDIKKVVIEHISGMRAGWRARAVDTKRISLNQKNIWGGYISAVHHKGYQLSAYSLNNPEKAKRWGKYGLYGAITDYPDRFTKSRKK